MQDLQTPEMIFNDKLKADFVYFDLYCNYNINHIPSVKIQSELDFILKNYIQTQYKALWTQNENQT